MLVTVSLILLALMAGAALALDMGEVLVECRHARNAADHAALAAAWAHCNGRNAQSAADSSVLRNGFDIWDLTLADTTDGSQAEINTTVDMAFAAVIGIDTVDVSGLAVARCSGGGGQGGAIFAFGDTCDDPGKIQLKLSGSKNTVYGGVHSNDNVALSGEQNNFGFDNPPDDPFTHVKPILDPAKLATNWFDTGYPKQVTEKLPEPDFIDIKDYGPGGSAAKAAAADGGKWFFSPKDWDKDEITERGEGLYYARGDIIVPKINGAFTFVAEGMIRAPAGESTLTPYVDNLLFMGAWDWSDPKNGSKLEDQCDSAVVTVNGSQTDWTGIIYAPNGLIKLEGSTNISLTGAVLGYSVDLSGSELVIIGDSSPAEPPGSPQLIK